MPTFERHCQDCINELGEPFEEVHLWLDEFNGDHGPSHRDARHHERAIITAQEKWGIKAAKAVEIHIKADCKGNIPTFEQCKLQALICNEEIFDILMYEFGDGK